MNSLRLLDRLGRSMKNPVMQALALYLVFLAAAFAGTAAGQKEIPILVGAALFTLYSLTNPFALVFARRFWLSLVLSIAAWFVLFVALGATIDSFKHMGDDGMVFLGAFMVFPVALAGAGIARLIRRRSPVPANPA
jgi:hypothetical protein